jgi:hypothetical protein
MDAQSSGNSCRQCGTRLATDNRDLVCGACRHKARDVLFRAPTVPASFWDSPQMQAALATRHMGKVVQAFREHPHHGRRISQTTAAGWLYLTQSRLSRIESGPPMHDLHRLTQIAHILGIPRHLLWFAPIEEAEARESAPSAAPPLTQNEHNLDDHTWRVVSEMLRRTFLQGGLAALASADFGGLSALPGDGASGASENLSPSHQESVLAATAPALLGLDVEEVERVAAALEDAHRYLEGPVVEYFRTQLDHAKHDDGSLGPKKILPLVLGLLRAVEQHARDVKPKVRRELLAVSADGAEFAGWLYRDIHRPDQAGFWYDRAMEWAQEADDSAMQGYVLLKKSQMAYDDRDAVKMFTLAEAAGHERWQLPGKVRAEVMQQQARAYAMVGEPMAKVERRLGEAHQLLDDFESGHDDGSQLSRHYSRANLTLQTASCYIEAGQPARAAGLYHGVLKGESLSRRDQGYFLARRAFSLALAGQPDEAAAVGLTSVRLADATNSLRTKRELGRVVRTLGPWATRPGPKELGQALRA